MEYKHTPGPWGINPKDVKLLVYDIASNERIATIKTVSPYIGSRAEAEANAQLIAAAPELLEALIKIYKSSYPNHAFDMGGEHPADIALRAITKATGGQPQ